MTRVALMIDGENISAKHIYKCIDKAEAYGDVIIKRVYANVAKTNNAWGEHAASQSVRYIHAQETANKKNTTDMLLAIDTMELALTNRADTFIFCSDDSDFGPLIQKLIELEKTVIGVGTNKANDGYKSSYTDFECLNTSPKLDNPIVKNSIIGLEDMLSINSETKQRFPSNLDFEMFMSICYQELQHGYWVNISCLGGKLAHFKLTKRNLKLVSILKNIEYFEHRVNGEHSQFRLRKTQQECVKRINNDDLIRTNRKNEILNTKFWIKCAKTLQMKVENTLSNWLDVLKNKKHSNHYFN
ncbi:NYN domain-containing protein [Vibrio sp. 10N.222.51.C8]|uniref:NYN domain-containing protein n=3 Tax=Vibrio TaxID=662 RepID=UPI000C81D2B3|nr:MULTISPECIES: NYN domain-containing protein [unclassified Vibrio]PMN92789.1 hypothetical protein BCT21_20690 [Vibrio sp. 10N.222.55.F9]PMN97226.1 hypothetical protein BCT20_17990 [Vibrio sp. 10N.222.55.C12]PMO21097.1 hypothetical protein BCT17_04020 [Vibrio sp. 10N.222.54.F10]PMO21257.1 hypothetical protein BCT16_07190 [Vibrio sp. 10N.222.54.B6]TKF38534.1 NYN domain-containing protein [Vibrio sp. F13]